MNPAMTKAQVIQSILDRINGRTYVEVGVRYGKIFKQIKARHKIAVDPILMLGIRGKISNLLLNTLRLKDGTYFGMTSDEFFLQKEGVI